MRWATTPSPRALAWADGRAQPLDRARVPLADRGHLLGDGVFETMRVVGGRIFQRPLHEDRLRRALATLGLSSATGRRAWDAADALLAAARRRIGPELRLRLQVTTGEGESLAGEAGRSSVTAIARAFEPYPARAYEKGLHVVVDPLVRPRRPPVKTTSLHAHAAARRRARALGADDALFLNVSGRVCEATTSNVVAIVGKGVYAPGPGEGALDGTTRRLVLALLKRRGLNVRTRLSHGGLMRATEVLLTNVVGGVVPVGRIEGRRLQGAAGPQFRLLRAEYDAAVAAFRRASAE